MRITRKSARLPLLISVTLLTVICTAQADQIVPRIEKICSSSHAYPGECFNTAEPAGALGCAKFYGLAFFHADPEGFVV